MIVLRSTPRRAAHFAFAVFILLVLPPTAAGFREADAAEVEQPRVLITEHPHRIASPFGTIHTAIFRLPQPIGTANPPAPVESVEERQAPARQAVNRATKADLLAPRPAFELNPHADAPAETAIGETALVSQSLAPFAHTRFCLQYPKDCEARPAMSSDDGIVLTEARWNELVSVNRSVNRAIIPARNAKGLLAERWVVSPRAGDCNDYAVTKRHELLARGWPADALLLAEVLTNWGEHHLVLVVHTPKGDFVLDNIDPRIGTMAQTRYQMVRIQSPSNPKYWLAARRA